MKKNKKILVLLIVTVLFFSGTVMIIINRMSYKEEWIEYAKYIFRASYEGNKPEKKEHRYFAVNDNGSFTQISQDELSENIKNKTKKVDVFGSDESDIWYVELSRFEDLNLVDRTVWRETDLASNIFITWYNWTDSTEDAEEEEIELFKYAAEYFRKIDPNAVKWKKDNEIGLDSFMVIGNDGNYLIKNDIGNVLYRMDDEDGLIEVIRCPDEGTFDYCWFL